MLGLGDATSTSMLGGTLGAVGFSSGALRPPV